MNEAFDPIPTLMDNIVVAFSSRFAIPASQMPLQFHDISYLAHAGDYGVARSPDSILGAGQVGSQTSLAQNGSKPAAIAGPRRITIQRGAWVARST